jgi:hypothetical protein
LFGNSQQVTSKIGKNVGWICGKDYW